MIRIAPETNERIERPELSSLRPCEAAEGIWSAAFFVLFAGIKGT